MPSSFLGIQAGPEHLRSEPCQGWEVLVSVNISEASSIPREGASPKRQFLDPTPPSSKWKGGDTFRHFFRSWKTERGLRCPEVSRGVQRSRVRPTRRGEKGAVHGVTEFGPGPTEEHAVGQSGWGGAYMSLRDPQKDSKCKPGKGKQSRTQKGPSTMQ